MLHGDPTIEQCQAACDRDSSCHQVVFESQGPWNTECWLGSNTMSNSQRPGASRNCDRAAARRSSLPCVDECYSKAGWTRNRAEETELDEQKSTAKSGFWRRRRRTINYAERRHKSNIRRQQAALERSHKGHMERTNKERGTKESTAKHHARAAAAAAESRNKHHARAAAERATKESTAKHHARAAAERASKAQVRERLGKERTHKVRAAERGTKER